MINAQTEANTWRKYLFRTSKRLTRWPEGAGIYSTGEGYLRDRTAVIHNWQISGTDGSIAINIRYM